MLKEVFFLILTGAFNGDAKDGMTSRAVGVHLGGTDAPVLVTHRHQLVHVVGSVHHVHRQVLNVHADVWKFLQLIFLCDHFHLLCNASYFLAAVNLRVLIDFPVRLRTLMAFYSILNTFSRHIFVNSKFELKRPLNKPKMLYVLIVLNVYDVFKTFTIFLPFK
jgi:hypothetical protein